jgi:hypothetical protein
MYRKIFFDKRSNEKYFPNFTIIFVHSFTIEIALIHPINVTISLFKRKVYLFFWDID